MINHLQRKALGVLPVFLLLAATGIKAAQPAIDLGTLGGNSSDASGINARGQVVGGSATSTGEIHAFLWERGKLIDLGTLGGNYSSAYAINERGQVVGSSRTKSGELHAFLWEDGTMRDLGTLGGPMSEAYAINERGHVVGASLTAAGGTQAFFWAGSGVLTGLGTLGGNESRAFGINDREQIAGLARDPAGVVYAVRWEHGAAQVLGGRQSIALGINSRGQVVGEKNPIHAALWEKDLEIELPLLQARAINNRGQVVGILPGLAFRAVLWEDGTVVELGTLGGDYGYARGINAGGDVVGVSSTASGLRHATLWARH